MFNKNPKLHSKLISKTRLFSIWQTQVNKKSKKFITEYISHNEASESVMVIPINKSGKVLFIKKYCPPLNKYELILPGGKLKPTEAAIAAVKRELIEEIGMKPRTIKKILTLNILPQYMIGKTHIFVAKNLSVDESLKKENYEIVSTIEVSVEDIFKLTQMGKITDSRTIAAIQFYKNYSL